jgi:hypothetical protein
VTDADAGAANAARPDPYLSVVVATRNDDHGGNPLRRLQALVNTFDQQCRRARLDAELIVVDWNPPSDRARVAELLAVPEPAACAYRFIEVPGELHGKLRYADVLPLFQMMAKNVGIRRARGRFVLATNIDIVLSTELVEYVASVGLRPRSLYRVDRHDIEADIPIDAPLDAQMEYCETHQLRVHGRWGSRPVDARGREVIQPDDIVDGRRVRLGRGWHVLESTGRGARFRWASGDATLMLGAPAGGERGEPFLELDVESSPYDPASWVDVTVLEQDAAIDTKRVSGRTRLRVRVGDAPRGAVREIRLRCSDAHPDTRTQLPVYERRDSLCYRVHSAALVESRPGAVGVQLAENGPAGSDRLPSSAPAAEPVSGGSPVASGSERWKASMADALARAIEAVGGGGLLNRVARASSDFRQIERALDIAGGKVRALEPLNDLADLHRLLIEQRPEGLHVNACGDFQLMAREDWEELRGYPEFQTFSMNIDGLLSYTADAAGIREETLPMPIYHLEHEVGSGWSPEGEAILRRRIAEAGVAWLDARTVYTWAAYMHWLGRPMIFNGSNWGLADADLDDCSGAPRDRSHERVARTRA